jgi:hypothetical protein
MFDLGDPKDLKLLPEAAGDSRHHQLQSYRLNSGLQRCLSQVVVVQTDVVDGADLDLDREISGD